jgi:hypothetical protein
MGRKLIAGSVLLVLLSFIACDEDCDSIFNSCADGPFYGDLKLLVTINDENPEVELVVFGGVIEKQDTLIHEFVTDKTIVYEMESGFYYSATASYVDGSRQIIAINGGELPTESDDCGCDYAGSKRLNLRLAK